jgi:UDP-2,3-diacylglucosamine hydrolase
VSGSIVFFSDAHLSANLPAKTAHILDFFGSADFRNAKAVYILGDLFDFWIGPKHIELPDYKDVFASLKSLTKKGKQINFLFGNRDFLVDKSFSVETGVNILGESHELKIDSRKIWLTHGDLLCTLDKDYQSYRRLARSKLVKSAYGSIPQRASYAIGKKLRSLSTNLVAKKTSQEKTITPKAVNALFKKGIDVIICGHIHETSHETTKDGKEIFTLGAFGNGGHYLIYEQGVFKPKQHHFQ